MNEPTAVAACEALCHEYARRADAGDAKGFAELFVEDGVFDRMGVQLKGREAIAGVISGRPAGTWSVHDISDVRITAGADGRSATGSAALKMRRGVKGDDQVVSLAADYHDRFVLTPAGWRFAERKVVIKS